MIWVREESRQFRSALFRSLLWFYHNLHAAHFSQQFHIVWSGQQACQDNLQSFIDISAAHFGHVCWWGDYDMRPLSRGFTFPTDGKVFRLMLSDDYSSYMAKAAREARLCYSKSFRSKCFGWRHRKRKNQPANGVSSCRKQSTPDVSGLLIIRETVLFGQMLECYSLFCGLILWKKIVATLERWLLVI